jgi:hypothetical protein
LALGCLADHGVIGRPDKGGKERLGPEVVQAGRRRDFSHAMLIGSDAYGLDGVPEIDGRP